MIATILNSREATRDRSTGRVNDRERLSAAQTPPAQQDETSDCPSRFGILGQLSEEPSAASMNPLHSGISPQTPSGTQATGMWAQSRLSQPSRDSTLSPSACDSHLVEDTTHRDVDKTSMFNFTHSPASDFSVPKVAEEQEQAGSMHDHLSMTSEILHLVATDPKNLARYDKAYHYRPKTYAEGEHKIKPLTKSFKSSPPPTGWRVFIHPEGARYFYFDDPSEPVAVLTEAWIYDSEQLQRTEQYMRQAFGYMKDAGICFRESSPSKDDHVHPQHPAPTVLVLDIRGAGDAGYYFVSHPTQTIFWLDTYDFSIAVSDVHIEHTSTSIGLEMRSHYWTHNALFPHLYELDDEDIEEVYDMVHTAIGDGLTSTTGVLVAFSREDLQEFKAIIPHDKLKKVGKRRERVGERWTICRVLSDFHHERFINLHGERGARLDCEQSIYSQSYSSSSSWPPNSVHKRFFRFLRSLASSIHSTTADDNPGPCEDVTQPPRSSIWMDILSLAMLGGPLAHARKLRSITVDRLVRRTMLEKYKEKMVEEWREVNLYGTVLLGANVSFLTILDQPVDDAGSQGPNRTPSQRVSYFSILASIGTILSSFLLLGQHREIMTSRFIVRRCDTRWGLESLALMYGMPFSIAIWSIITFFLSFAILWLDSTDYVVVGLVLFFTVIFSFILVWATLVLYKQGSSPQPCVMQGAEMPPAVQNKPTLESKEETSDESTMEKLSAEGVTEAGGVHSVGFEGVSSLRESSKIGVRRPVWSSTSSTMV